MTPHVYIKTLTRHVNDGTSQAQATSLEQNKHGSMRDTTELRTRGRHKYSWALAPLAHATATGGPVLGVDGHHAAKLHSGRAGLRLARGLRARTRHEAGGGREQQEAVGAVRPEVDDARHARLQGDRHEASRRPAARGLCLVP